MPKCIAFYLPQFHPIPENDRWWGLGFTEWTNVTKAKPLFRGHYQPHLPADLGFCDLRLSEVRESQAALAKEYGIGGFCYYHYWFNGNRLLDRPFNEVLQTRRPEFPFCLCWANEPWSRRWLGEERDVLMPQAYSENDDRNHAKWLVPAFLDSRYIKVDGRPLFLIYRPNHIPNINSFVSRFSLAVFEKVGVKPYMVAVDAHAPGFDFRSLGFDRNLTFQPQLSVSPGAFYDGPSNRRLLRNLGLGVCSRSLRLYDDTTERDRMADAERSYDAIPCCYVSWDNSARRGKNGIVYINNSPETFRVGLRRAIARAKSANPSEQFVFINAWNEWAEGNHLEPDARWGRSFLEVVRQELES